MTVIEKVARAIRKTPARPGGFVEYEDIARAALEALRDYPSPEMLWAHELPNIGPDEIRELWSAMIDAALNEPAVSRGAGGNRWSWGYPDGVPGTPEYEPAARICNWCGTVESRCHCDGPALNEPAS